MSKKRISESALLEALAFISLFKSDSRCKVKLSDLADIFVNVFDLSPMDVFETLEKNQQHIINRERNKFKVILKSAVKNKQGVLFQHNLGTFAKCEGE